IVAGTPAADAGDVEAPIGRFAEQRLWAIKEDGKPAHTRFWVRERGAVAALLELEPVTGRTNQLRIHLAHIGHPIVGDVKYGGPEFSRLCLHAARIRINHPTTGVGVGFASPVPAEMEFSNVCV
ncbi:MAG TPA: pseudouridine synthase, partial [Pyrinomonadaceae bacterium]|nr:pseudouridine synthase [Pyrinomonadaceae bacterium]